MTADNSSSHQLTVKNKKSRLFFAIWPSTLIRESIVKISDPVLYEIDGRIIQPDNLHITLHFIGSVTDDIRDCMHKTALTVVVEPFDIILNCFGYFDKAKIFWMASKECSAELNRLHKNLGAALTACDFHSDKQPYKPHVSLLRKSEKIRTDYPEFSINWHVDEFVLVESSVDADGVCYKVLETY